MTSKYPQFTVKIVIGNFGVDGSTAEYDFFSRESAEKFFSLAQEIEDMECVQFGIWESCTQYEVVKTERREP